MPPSKKLMNKPLLTIYIINLIIFCVKKVKLLRAGKIGKSTTTPL